MLCSPFSKDITNKWHYMGYVHKTYSIAHRTDQAIMYYLSTSCFILVIIWLTLFYYRVNLMFQLNLPLVRPQSTLGIALVNIRYYILAHVGYYLCDDLKVHFLTLRYFICEYKSSHFFNPKESVCQVQDPQAVFNPCIT